MLEVRLEIKKSRQSSGFFVSMLIVLVGLIFPHAVKLAGIA